MRDYRLISAEEFVLESIEMKLRWLARQLRKIDNSGEIMKWVNAVTSLSSLKKTISYKCGDCSIKTNEPQLISNRSSFSISEPNRIDWQSYDFLGTKRSGTPIPVDLPELKRFSPTWRIRTSVGPPLAPCAELKEPQRKRTGIKRGRDQSTTDMKESSLDIEPLKCNTESTVIKPTTDVEICEPINCSPNSRSDVTVTTSGEKDNPKITPSRFQSKERSSKSSISPEVNDDNPHRSSQSVSLQNLRKALHQQLDVKGIPFNYFREDAERFEVLFNAVEDDLGLKRNTIKESEIKLFLLREMGKYYHLEVD